ncbi:hypothetical protein BD410DRAFT_790119 [Rickenella mellea]|uniref:Uncharacterized protein n=1 Tax=Rickenella mellea TaxID=50990 RepID=A0A4Y7Q0Y9_9AGAM|nr:hypothetical protein BD410DRAFT_790119 [Rickenella mellea]
MSIDPGAYEIRNVMYQNYANQYEGKVVGYADHDVPSIPRDVDVDLTAIWSISRLNNGKYTLRNIDSNDYAASRTFPSIEENIIVTPALQQWDIKETAIKGRYVIYTTAADIELFWGLTNGWLFTEISLRDIPNTPSNQWQLTKFDSWRLLGQVRKKLAELRHVNSRLSEDYQKLRDDYSKLQDEHTKLQDEHTKLSNTAERRDGDAVEAVQKGGARNLKAGPNSRRREGVPPFAGRDWT